MKIKINDKKIDFTGNTLLDLIYLYGFNDKTGIAIAVNGTVVPKAEWQSYFLKEEDEILIITPAQGG